MADDASARPSPPHALTGRVTRGKLLVLVVLGVGPLVALAFLPAIPQSQVYHAFADGRPLLGIPNFLNVATNVPFVVVGLLGIRLMARAHGLATRLPWLAFFAGVTLVSAGSAAYHWAPTNESLVWDRLPMTVGFMGLWIALLAEYLDPRVVRPGLPIALLVGAASVILWAMTDDLRLYVWVQGVPMLTVVAMMLLFRPTFTHTRYLLAALAFYGAAKAVEVYDRAIWEATDGLLSGHPLKHVLAAAGCWWLYQMLRVRRPVTAAPPATASRAP